MTRCPSLERPVIDVAVAPKPRRDPRVDSVNDPLKLGGIHGASRVKLHALLGIAREDAVEKCQSVREDATMQVRAKLLLHVARERALVGLPRLREERFEMLPRLSSWPAGADRFDLVTATPAPPSRSGLGAPVHCPASVATGSSSRPTNATCCTRVRAVRRGLGGRLLLAARTAPMPPCIIGARQRGPRCVRRDGAKSAILRNSSGF